MDLYEYGFRWYDAAIGRFTGVDPLAFVYYSSSPYAYVENDPISHTDPTGMFKTKFGAWLYKTFNGGGQIEYAKDKGEYYVGQQVESDNAATYKRVFRADSSKPSGGITNAIDYFPTELGFAGKRFVEQGGHVENAGDIVSGAGMVITPYAPPVGAEVMAFGEGVSLFGVGMQIIDIAASPEGNKLREIIKKVAVEGLPVALSYPLRKAIKNLKISENEKKILESLLDGGAYSMEKGMENPVNETIDKIENK